jgi:hypothetical protein
MDGYLTKPIQRAELFRELDRIGESIDCAVLPPQNLAKLAASAGPNL